GFLTDQFNQMLKQIQKHETALKNASKELKNKAQQLQKELSERKQAEKKIKQSLEEKEILIKEIHHRVKNNLQVVSSLLYLQSRKTNNKKTNELFIESQTRIRSMALIHEMLYQADYIMNIDFSNYIKDLISYLFHSYEINRNIISTKITVDDIFLNINKAIPCGLILNELISNSLKHAFPKGKDGTISVTMTSDKQKEITLIIQDDGIGFPQDLQLEKTDSLGLQLVKTLTNQLGGTITLHENNGSKFLIKFKI
ncbi:MAG: histidine kinase dimerization/phosphoacceptor domain -containing protein, partial [bacterium]